MYRWIVQHQRRPPNMDEFGRNKNEEKRTPSDNIQSSRDVCDDIAECSADDLTNMGMPATAKDSCNIFLGWTHV